MTLEGFIHSCFIIGLGPMVAVVLIMAIQILATGTDAHQRANRERIAASTKPDTSDHEVYYAGFFHPYPNAGGGGERVLWTMIKAIQEKYPFVVSVIYSGDSITCDKLLENVQRKFGLNINPDTVYVVELQKRWWIDHKFPRLTLAMQSLGSVMLTAEAVHKLLPDMFIDTIGYAFTYPFMRLLTSTIPVVSYTHYPTISSDMQSRISSRESGFNNSNTIAQSPTLSFLKSAYYMVFARLYSFAGSFASTVMTNSTWTHNHIVSLFGNPNMTRVVYPPCDTESLQSFDLDFTRAPFIISLAQFRPEKNHRLQIEAFAEFLKSHPDCVLPESEKKPTPEDLLAKATSKDKLMKYPFLIMLGGARNIDDEARAEELRQLSSRLGVSRQVHVIINVQWSEVMQWLRYSKVGMHTMRDEHFGINIVEMMAAGLVTIAHDSAGPKLDIIKPAIRCSDNNEIELPSEKQASDFIQSIGNVSVDVRDTKKDRKMPVGMLGTTATEFSALIATALEIDGVISHAIRAAARERAIEKFSESTFTRGFIKRFNPVIRWLDIQRSDDDESYE